MNFLFNSIIKRREIKCVLLLVFLNLSGIASILVLHLQIFVINEGFISCQFLLPLISEGFVLLGNLTLLKLFVLLLKLLSRGLLIL